MLPMSVNAFENLLTCDETRAKCVADCTSEEINVEISSGDVKYRAERSCNTEPLALDEVVGRHVTAVESHSKRPRAEVEGHGQVNLGRVEVAELMDGQSRLMRDDSAVAGPQRPSD
jgi:hypothetical protein